VPLRVLRVALQPVLRRRVVEPPDALGQQRQLLDPREHLQSLDGHTEEVEHRPIFRPLLAVFLSGDGRSAAAVERAQEVDLVAGVRVVDGTPGLSNKFRDKG
jgi:hypothetical protein